MHAQGHAHSNRLYIYDTAIPYPMYRILILYPSQPRPPVAPGARWAPGFFLSQFSSRPFSSLAGFSPLEQIAGYSHGFFSRIA